MKITAITPYVIWVGTRNQLIVKVETDEGVYGWGEAGFSFREQAVAMMIEHFAKFIIGQDPMNIGRIWQECYRSHYFEGGRVVTAAMAAVDIALHDIKGKVFAKISLDKLLTYSLRMSPDRIILGEIRSEEILTFILGMNTGHKGIISSIHANNAKDALNRLAMLYSTYANSNINYAMVLKLICSNIDYVVYIENKKIVEIIEVFGSEGMNVFFDLVS